jgi:hypothetical protein
MSGDEGLIAFVTPAPNLDPAYTTYHPSALTTGPSLAPSAGAPPTPRLRVVTPSALNVAVTVEIIRGKRTVTADTALRLGKYFGFNAWRCSGR